MRRICALYGVSRSGYYAWCQRPPSERSIEDERLLARISEVHESSRGTYGSPRVHEALRADGEEVGRRRVARLMRENAIRARCARLYRANPGHHEFFTNIGNQVRKVEVTGCNQVWVGDVTYLKVGTGWTYLAVVMDRYSRRVLGWSFGRSRDAGLTLKALASAVRARGGVVGKVFHSDRGVEYASYRYRHRLDSLGIQQSMNRPRRMNDNAHVESFFGSMKSDFFHGQTFRTEAELRGAIASYMMFYNRQRTHTALGYRTPEAFEASIH